MTFDIANEYFIYENGKLFWKKKCARNVVAGRRVGCLDTAVGYRSIHFRKRNYREHHIIYLLCTGIFPKSLDHINGIRDDNRIENLRELSQEFNSKNRGLNKNSTTGHTGVYKNIRGDWYVQVRINGKSKTIGTYSDFELACLVADEARSKYYGKYAKVNNELR